MIRSFRHKGLKKLFEDGSRAKVQAAHADKLERILARLDASTDVQDMNLPGYRLHPLKGDYAGHWAVDVSGNWRVIFKFEDGDAMDVDYLDYH